jgi:protocatechuate 3,4-dioxygenase beta subunit
MTVDARHQYGTDVRRAVLDEDGSYRFLTSEPGTYPWRNDANAWLRSVPDQRRPTLFARPVGDEDGADRCQFGTVLQGTDETVFFDA